jgi:triphosphoribosyl-dephospho-CoA synthase
MTTPNERQRFAPPGRARSGASVDDASSTDVSASGSTDHRQTPVAAPAWPLIDVGVVAQLACLIEVSAPKPGNVSPGRPFPDATYEDFLASAAAIGAPLAAAGCQPLGSTIRQAVEATARWVRSNTNLGIILLLAPLARAACVVQDSHDEAGTDAVTGGSSRGFSQGGSSGYLRGSIPADLHRAAVRKVLTESTVADARDVYAAIRLAAPGGLGRVATQDVATDPDATLLEVMRLAAHRDGVAREYATAFETTFEVGAPALARARLDGLSWEDAVVETFLRLLAGVADTHIVRRGGEALGEEVSRRARAVLDAGGVRSTAGRSALEAMDKSLRDSRHLANAGTTADLTAAAVFVVLLGGGWQEAGLGRHHAAAR